MLETIVIGILAYLVFRFVVNVIKGRGPKPAVVGSHIKKFGKDIKEITSTHVTEMSRDRKLAVYLELQQDEDFQAYLERLKVEVPAEPTTEQTI